MKTDNWETERGAKIELTTEHITSEIIDLDGDKAEVKADRIRIVELKVNGVNHQATLQNYQGKKVLNFGEKAINGKIHPLMVLIPDNTYQEIWGEYDKRQNTKLEAGLKADAEYQKHYNKVKKMMEE